MVRLIRAQMNRAPGIDITVKSAQGYAREFAPTWDMVMGHKRGTVTDERYVEQYHAMLRAASREAWRWLRDQGQESGQICLVCYCGEGKFCHTHVLIEFMLAHWPHLFADGREA